MLPRFMNILLLIFVVAAREVVAFSSRSSHTSRHADRMFTQPCCLLLSASSNNNNNKDSFDMSELSRRIEGLQTADKLLGTNNIINNNDNNENSVNIDGSASLQLDMPVLVFDALLPNQRLSGRTSDSTFVRLLARLGLGGIFCMVSVNYAQRKIRRNGVVCRIELMNAPNPEGLSKNGIVLTAVDFQVVGIRRCRVVGSAEGMKARIGRWRRCWDPDGEKSVLGFGEERFVDVDESVASMAATYEDQSVEEIKGLSTQDWNSALVDCAIEDADNDQKEAMQKAQSLIPLLEKWQELASNVKTYENTDVVVSSRIMKGEPGLRVDPAALLRRVRADLGEQPSSSDPVALALWGAALINPVPALGASPEIRGRVLEAPDSMSKLKILEWGINRSIANLNGTTPL